LIAVLLNPTDANFKAELRGVQEAARAVGQQLIIVSAMSIPIVVVIPAAF